MDSKIVSIVCTCFYDSPKDDRYVTVISSPVVRYTIDGTTPKSMILRLVEDLNAGLDIHSDEPYIDIEFLELTKKYRRTVVQKYQFYKHQNIPYYSLINSTEYTDER